MPFAKPGEHIPNRLTDYVDQPVLIRPKEYRKLDTTFGESLVLMADVLVLIPRDKTAAINLGEVPIFWKGVQRQIEESAGMWVLGRLHQGTASNPKEYILEDPQLGDDALGEAAVAQFDAPFGGSVRPEQGPPF
jgi:hypothetical protein